MEVRAPLTFPHGRFCAKLREEKGTKRSSTAVLAVKTFPSTRDAAWGRKRNGPMQAVDLSKAQRWVIMGGAAAMLSLAMGMRQSFGLFQPEIVKAIGITSSDFSLALALQNGIWG